MTRGTRDRLPPPADVTESPKVLVGQLRDLVGEPVAVEVCVDLLGGADAREYRAEIPYLAGQAAPGLIEGTWQVYWGRVWGARGLLYVWGGSAAPVVIRGLRDEAWRVAEMCLKVSALRELAESADAAVDLAEHELPRVRANALRTLGLVGDTEHAGAVEAGLDDEEAQVRRAAALARRRMAARLDLPAWDDL